MEKNKAEIRQPRAAGSEEPAGSGDIARESKIQDLITGLGSLNAHRRHVARRALVALSSLALPALRSALASSDWHVRWEAAKAMGEIGSPDGAPALVHLLMDEDTGVRWAAMGSLIRIGRPAVRPMLELLAQEFHSARLREGVYHVLHELKNRGKLMPAEKHVINALEGPSPMLEAPWAAQEALKAEAGEQ